MEILEIGWPELTSYQLRGWHVVDMHHTHNTILIGRASRATSLEIAIHRAQQSASQNGRRIHVIRFDDELYVCDWTEPIAPEASVIGTAFADGSYEAHAS